MKYFVIVFLALFVTLSASETTLSMDDTSYVAGKSYYDANKYIEYIPGNMPLVLSAPHGGYDKPDEISNRSRSALNQDIRTLELTLMLGERIKEVTGKQPYIIINRLHRIKLDPNRIKEVAIQGDSLAGIAFDNFHKFIEIAEEDVFNKWGTGFYIDVHAHPFEHRKIELGYLLEAELLFFSDEELNDDLFISKSSIRNLVKDSEYKFSDILRGEVSMGAMLENKGWQVIPSPKNPEPEDQFYFSGGYNTAQHAAKEKYNFNGLQIETHWTGLRDTDNNMQKFCADFTDVIIDFLIKHYKMDLREIK